ncbi:hypothetical protein SUGI_1027870 [Cryptomeria japonica]|nr:hypothetical protein SUGI_1027870 [Cryptomeria japonica]
MGERPRGAGATTVVGEDVGEEDGGPDGEMDGAGCFMNLLAPSLPPVGSDLWLTCWSGRKCGAKVLSEEAEVSSIGVNVGEEDDLVWRICVDSPLGVCVFLPRGCGLGCLLSRGCLC